MGLTDIEKRLERLVGEFFTRAFKSGLQPVELARQINRELDLSRQVGVNNTLISPNKIVVNLSEEDFRRFEAYKNELEEELEEGVRSHAREENYRFLGSVDVKIERDNKLKGGQSDIKVSIEADPGGLPSYTLVLSDGRRFKLGKESMLIGRLPELDVTINDSTVSRRHAEIRRAGNDAILIDLGSTNGTRLNGAIITRARLNNGDEITFGSYSAYFEAA